MQQLCSLPASNFQYPLNIPFPCIRCEKFPLKAMGFNLFLRIWCLAYLKFHFLTFKILSYWESVNNMQQLKSCLNHLCHYITPVQKISVLAFCKISYRLKSGSFPPYKCFHNSGPGALWLSHHLLSHVTSFHTGMCASDCSLKSLHCQLDLVVCSYNSDCRVTLWSKFSKLTPSCLSSLRLWTV